MQCGKWRRAPQEAPRAPHLARESGGASSQACAEVRAKARKRCWTLEAPLVFVEQTAQFIEFLFRRVAAFERVQHELAGRAFEDALQNVARQLALRFLGRLTCFVDVGTLRFVSTDRALGGHDLEKF